MMNIDIEFYEGGRDVLVIFTGIGGTTKGYQNKYEKIAKYVTSQFHFSVFVATTPLGSWATLKENLQSVLNFVFKKLKSDSLNIYVMGSSAGANMVLSFSYLFPQIKKILAINPVMNVNFHWIENGIKNFKGGDINVVLGEKDLSSSYAKLLPKHEKLKLTILPDIDHYFQGHLSTFIDLPRFYLFY